MIVHLMNLDRSTDRLRRFGELNAHLSSVVRVSAIEGRQQDLSDLLRRGVIGEAVLDRYSAGSLGNALSHFALWERAIGTDEVVTVCEDDAIFNRHFDAQSASMIGSLPADWDIVLWGWNFDGAMVLDLGAADCVVFGNENQLIENVAAFQAREIAAQPMRLRSAFGTFCYSVSPKGALALKERCVPIRDMAFPLPWPVPGIKTSLEIRGLVANTAIDVMMSVAYPQLLAFVAFPPIVMSKNEKHSSTLHGDTVLRDILSSQAGAERAKAEPR